MCGIVGIFNMTNAQDADFSEKDKSFLIKYLLSELTIETESRGRDATGYFSLFQDGNGIGLKHGIKASTFCTKDWDNGEFTFKNHLKLIEAYHNEISPMSIGLSHCRAKTVGTETNNDNNHPIFVGDYVGIHNGCLSNHTKIYSNIKDEIERVGTVDSEMIVQLLWLGTKKGEKKLNTNLIKYITERLEGTYAFIGIDKKDPKSALLMRDARPIDLVYIRKAGILVALSDKRFFKSVIEKYEWFKFYGVDTPEIDYEEYTLPDDKGFILNLDTEITPETKIEKLIGDVITIEKTDSDWAGTNYYSGRNSGYYSRKSYKCYDVQEDNNDDKNLPACYQETGFKAGGNTTGDAVKTGKVVSLKKIEKEEEKKEEKNSNNDVSETKQVQTVVWNSKKKEFDTKTKDKTEMYKPMDQAASRYTIFTSVGSLATKLNIEKFALDTLTSPQLANRVSKMVYEEHAEELAEKVTILEKKEEQFENKATKARQHIIKLRGLINIVIRMLNSSYKPDQVVLTSQEVENINGLWKFLYSTRKAELKNSSLGKFILSLQKEKTA